MRIFGYDVKKIRRSIGTLTRVPWLTLAKHQEAAQPILTKPVRIHRIENTKLADRTVFWFGGLQKNSTYQISIIGTNDPRQIYEVYTDKTGEVELGKIVHLIKMTDRIMKAN